MVLSKNEIFSNVFKAKTDTGIYFLIMKEEIVYVGQTIRFFSRIKTHWKDDRKIFDSFAFIEVPEGSLNEMEKKYIKKYRPVYNIKHNQEEKKKVKVSGPFKRYLACAIVNTRNPHCFLFIFCSTNPEKRFKAITESAKSNGYKTTFEKWLGEQIKNGENFTFTIVGSGNTNSIHQATYCHAKEYENDPIHRIMNYNIKNQTP